MSKSRFTVWCIVSMTAWDEDYLNEEVEAFIEFDDKGGGSFQFGYVQGFMDCRERPREVSLRRNSRGRVATALTARR